MRARTGSVPVATLVLITAAACRPMAPADQESSASLDLSQYEIVDLTHPFNERTIYWPTSPTSFQLDTLSYGETPGGWFYSAFAFSTPEHGGTHMDAPIHFAAGGHSVDRIPVERFIAPAVVIDVRERT